MKVKPACPTNAFRCFFFIPAFVAVLLLSCSPVVEDREIPGTMRRAGPQEQQQQRMAGIRPSGLQPVFPDEARCPEIASPFGSYTRYDGSPRPKTRYGGYHGGIDLSLPEGTPLLALAAGTVVSKGEGGLAEGIYLWLRHSPEDTGLPYWVFSKYQHFEAIPELPGGAKVAMGQVIGRSGKTGTVGPHYGASGYPHLHLTTVRSPSGEYQIEGSRVAATGGYLFDPVVVYHETSPKPQGSARPSLGEKAVAIPYMTTDGQAWPQGTRVVWPVACRRR